MGKTKKNTHLNKEALKNPEKDYAHYPPTPLQPVTKPLANKLKETEKTPAGQDAGAGVSLGNSNTRTHRNVTEDDERIVNGADDTQGEETYFLVSAGAFEATEQV